MRTLEITQPNVSCHKKSDEQQNQSLVCPCFQKCKQAEESEKPERSENHSLNKNRLIRPENTGKRYGEQNQNQKSFLGKQELFQAESGLSKDFSQHKGHRDKEQDSTQLINLSNNKQKTAYAE